MTSVLSCHCAQRHPDQTHLQRTTTAVGQLRWTFASHTRPNSNLGHLSRVMSGCCSSHCFGLHLQGEYSRLLQLNEGYRQVGSPCPGDGASFALRLQRPCLSFDIPRRLHHKEIEGLFRVRGPLQTLCAVLELQSAAQVVSGISRSPRNCLQARWTCQV